ncbi:PREDICTED: fas-binding factor 1, partial [Tinamus guttatus]|uniref:fas-binding factor 1 n=1 Tax=Tinamus guttatus TaxID=94827 RepID=UPI00052E7C4D
QPVVHALPQAAALQDTAVRADTSSHPVPQLSTPEKAPALPTESRKEDPSRDASVLASTALFSGEQETPGPVALTQAAVPRTHVPAAAPQPQTEPLALGLLHGKGLGAPVLQLPEDGMGCQAALLSAQAHVAELERQVQALELERMQQKVLLENLQQRHQEDLDLLESAHKSRVKVVEETCGQRAERLQQEKEQLAAQLAAQGQAAERAQAELLQRHQQQLRALEQQSAQELQRLQELQRTSVQEMRKDHEEQLQRLKRLKDQEIDAVTSATSHTRSLNGVIEQMEKFSSDLHNLSHRVEATHHSTSQELAMGAQQRDKQLKVLQDRLLQQQRDMEEERGRLQEVIAKMEARLGEQTRLLEQERWRATAEQSKVESLQRSLEEQRRVMTQQLSMERAELERAKMPLLEEQKSVMQRCSEERRKLAAEWAEFHTQQQLSKERLERDMELALQRDSQREGTILSLAKEQAELKIRAGGLKVKEEQLVRDRELLEQAWQELRLEKEKVNRAALHVRQRAEEIDTMSKLSAQKCEEGEQALREARRVESEHQARLRLVQQQLEQLKQQEQHLHQERLSVALQRSQLQQLREELPNSPALLLATAQDVSGATTGLSSTLSLVHVQALIPGFPTPTTAFPRCNPGGSRDSLGTAGPSELYAKLLLLKHRAQQDRDFLEDEQFFLETLKKASYNTSSLLA